MAIPEQDKDAIIDGLCIAVKRMRDALIEISELKVEDHYTDDPEVSRAVQIARSVVGNPR